AGFRAKRHNANLCPELQSRVEQTVGTVERYMTLTYDIQGLRDYGIDVLVRLSGKDDLGYIGFQVKADDECTKGVYEKLKAQYTDALNMYGDDLLDYFVALAWDQKARQDEIRLVEEAFQGIRGVHVVEPT